MLWKRVSLAIALFACLCGPSFLDGQTPLSPPERDKALAGIREYALNYGKTLSDYSCIALTQQEIPRALKATPPDKSDMLSGVGPDRKAVVEEEITVADSRAFYKVLKFDYGGLTENRPEMASVLVGRISIGEFGSALNRIFAADTGATFRWVRADKLRGRPVLVFAVEVPRAHGLNVSASARRETVVGYKGLVYADEVSKAILRVEIHSSDFPSGSTVQGMDLALDYKATTIAGRELIVPYRYDEEWRTAAPEAPATPRKPAYRFTTRRNFQTEYKDYLAYSAQSSFAGPDSLPDNSQSTIRFVDIPVPGNR